jgi:hypothetical protein
VAECVGPPETRIATTAFATTAPEGSVTCPRIVPVVADVNTEGGLGDDCAVDVCGIALCPVIVAGLRISAIRTARTKINKCFNLHLILSKQIIGLKNMGSKNLTKLGGYCAASPSPPAPSDHGESNEDAL